MKRKTSKTVILVIAAVLWLLGVVGIFTDVSIPYAGVFLALGGLIAIAVGLADPRPTP